MNTIACLLIVCEILKLLLLCNSWQDLHQKMLPLHLDPFVPVQNLEEKSHQHQKILPCTLDHTQLMHLHEMISNVTALYILCNFEEHLGMSYFDVIQMNILSLRILMRVLH